MMANGNKPVVFVISFSVPDHSCSDRHCVSMCCCKVRFPSRKTDIMSTEWSKVWEVGELWMVVHVTFAELSFTSRPLNLSFFLTELCLWNQGALY